MKHINKLFFVICVTGLLFSCSKEYSVESNGKTDSSLNCKLEKLIETDPVSGDAEYAYISTYDAINQVSNIQAVDSTTNSVDASFSITYPAGKVQVDAEQFFVTGSNGKVTEFHGYEFPDDNSSEKFTAKYTYNGFGQLSRRTEEFDSMPGVVIYQIDYSYTGNNVSKVEVSFNLGPSLVKVGEIVYEYDASRTVKSFISLHAAAPELFYFQTAVNAGLSASNPVTKATVRIVDTTGNINSYVTNFVRYNVDANDYVQSFEVTGNDFQFAGLASGSKYVLNYSCL